MKSEKILKKYCREDGSISLSFIYKKDLHFFPYLSVKKYCDIHNINYAIASDSYLRLKNKTYKIFYGTVIAKQDFIVISNELKISEGKINKKTKSYMLLRGKVKKSIDLLIKIYYPSLDVKVINKLKFYNYKRPHNYFYIITYFKISVEIYYSYLVANKWENLPTENSDFLAFKENVRPLRDELLEIWSLPGPTEIIDFIGWRV